MDQQVFKYKSEALNALQAGTGTLKILAGMDGVSMLALDASNNVLALDALELPDKKGKSQYWASDLTEYLNGHPLLQMSFGKTRAALSSHQATLVPQRLFSVENYASYFKLLLPTENGTVYGHEPLLDFGCQLVWGASPLLQPFIGQYKPRHLAACLIEQYHALTTAEGQSIFLNLRGQTAQITVFDHKSLAFYNSFDFVKPVDLLYFVLLVYDQFKLSPEQHPLRVSGALLQGSDHFNMLHKYVRQIAFVAYNGQIALPASALAQPAHYWFDLFSF